MVWNFDLGGKPLQAYRVYRYAGTANELHFIWGNFKYRVLLVIVDYIKNMILRGSTAQK